MSAGPEDVKPCVKCGARDRKKPSKGKKIGKCRPCERAYYAAYYAANPEKARAAAYRAACRAANPEKAAAYHAAYYAANREKVRARRAAYHAANPEKTRARISRRRAKKKKVKQAPPGCPRVFAIQRMKLAMRAVGINVHVDHYIPIDMGGPDTADNLRIISARENLKKGNKHPDDFYATYQKEPLTAPPTTVWSIPRQSQTIFYPAVFFRN